MGTITRQDLGRIRINPLLGLPSEQKVKSSHVIPSNIYIVRLDTNSEVNREIERLRVQTIPLELNINNEANWAIIPTIGRNNPFYHYTGGEDVLNFTIDWYSADALRDDVIHKCMWVESLTRANAYKDPPPKILLIWGDMFPFDTWIVTKAQYKLSLFDREYGMLPRQAYQEIELKKITKANRFMSDRRFRPSYLVNAPVVQVGVNEA